MVASHQRPLGRVPNQMSEPAVPLVLGRITIVTTAAVKAVSIACDRASVGKSRHRRIKKRRRYERLAATSHGREDREADAFAVPTRRRHGDRAARRSHAGRTDGEPTTRRDDGRRPDAPAAGTARSALPTRDRLEAPGPKTGRTGDGRGVASTAYASTTTRTRSATLLRANPYPEVTDRFCRLPLPTLFYAARGCSPRRPAADIGTNRREDSAWPSLEFSRSPLTRAHVRLLGPCFKTGRKVARNSSPTDGTPPATGPRRRFLPSGEPTRSTGVRRDRSRRNATAATNRHPGPSAGAQRVATSANRAKDPAGG
ncbi:hypothetical protein H4Q26_018078 [Puccinia striiformis f. sp. tritici PST-130]|nr:hypothetical protein H4Q26_018078 [Puccinia striiformis f. sp. tritici PST-130]